MARGQAAQPVLRSRALLLKRVAYADSDLIVTLLCEEIGKVSALARGARRSQRRFAGALEPMHTLRVAVQERSTSELYVLSEASLDRPRHQLTASLEALEAAGRALSWLSRACVPKTPEPRAWSVTSGLLDALDEPGQPRSARILLAEFGLGLLAALGWGLDFQRCVSCSKSCEPDRAAFVDAARGGLVCRACGGAHQRLDAPLRSRLAAHAALPDSRLLEEDVEATLRLVESALRAHVGEV